jgi:hypothetical protein
MAKRAPLGMVLAVVHDCGPLEREATSELEDRRAQ